MAIHKVRLQPFRIAKSYNFERGCAATCCTLWADSARQVMNLTWISTMKREKIPHKKDWIKERDIAYNLFILVPQTLCFVPRKSRI